ncbi:MAG: GNAT family N-acetyltransferase, partial [Alsobacter sp.]
AAPVRGLGLAAGLLGMGIDHARTQGATRLVLWSDTRFVDGHRFYVRHGFHRFAGTRALHDAAATLEFGFSRDIAGPAAGAAVS